MTVYSTDVVSGENATATQMNNLRKDALLGTNLYQAETYAANIAIDCSDSAKGKFRTLTLTGNPSITLAGAVAGQVIIIRFKQDGTGGRVPTITNSVIFEGQSDLYFSPNANGVDLYIFICNNATTQAFDVILASGDMR